VEKKLNKDDEKSKEMEEVMNYASQTYEKTDQLSATPQLKDIKDLTKASASCSYSTSNMICTSNSSASSVPSDETSQDKRSSSKEASEVAYKHNIDPIENNDFNCRVMEKVSLISGVETYVKTPSVSLSSQSFDALPTAKDVLERKTPSPSPTPSLDSLDYLKAPHFLPLGHGNLDTSKLGSTRDDYAPLEESVPSETEPDGHNLNGTKNEDESGLTLPPIKIKNGPLNEELRLDSPKEIEAVQESRASLDRNSKEKAANSDSLTPDHIFGSSKPNYASKPPSSIVIEDQSIENCNSLQRRKSEEKGRASDEGYGDDEHSRFEGDRVFRNESSSNYEDNEEKSRSRSDIGEESEMTRERSDNYEDIEEEFRSRSDRGEESEVTRDRSNYEDNEEESRSRSNMGEESEVTRGRSDETNSIAASSSGPMWREACKLAETEEAAFEREEHLRDSKYNKVSQSPTAKSMQKMAEQIEQRVNLRKKKAQISQSLLARTRSRADVDTLVPTAISSSLFRATGDKDPVTNTTEESHGIVNSRSLRETQNMSHIGDEGPLGFAPKIVRKRTKVVQLLVIGLLGIIGGFFGGVYALSTCNFASADVEVGNNNFFRLHFGMWKYSPLDSVFQGYSYCYQYDDEYTADAPMQARIVAVTALISGSASLSVLWIYLILGVTKEFYWKNAVRLSVLAGFCQASTALFFRGNICQRNSCVLGPGAIISLITTIVWFIVAYEMHHNAPMSAMLPNLSGKLSGKTTAQFFSIEMPEWRTNFKSIWNQLPFQNKEMDIIAPISFHYSQSDVSFYSSSESSYQPPKINNIL